MSNLITDYLNLTTCDACGEYGDIVSHGQDDKGRWHLSHTLCREHDGLYEVCAACGSPSTRLLRQPKKGGHPEFPMAASCDDCDGFEVLRAHRGRIPWQGRMYDVEHHGEGWRLRDRETGALKR